MSALFKRSDFTFRKGIETHLEQRSVALALLLPDVLEAFRDDVGHVETLVLAFVGRRSGHSPKEPALGIGEFLSKIERSFGGFQFLDSGERRERGESEEGRKGRKEGREVSSTFFNSRQ